VRIFRVITIILLAIPIWGQSTFIYIDNSDILKINNIKNISDSLEIILSESNKIGDELILTNVLTDSTLKYQLIENKVVIDTLISSNDEIRTIVFNQIYRSIIGTFPYRQSDIQFRRVVNSFPFINDSSSIAYFQYNNNKIGVLINTKSNFNNYFAGLIGASNNNENMWTVNGQIDIHLENQWRTANQLDLHWKRLDDESQVLNLNIEEPHPFGLPIGLAVGYNQDLREGSFINNESSVGIIKVVPGIAKFGFGGKNINITTTDKGDSLGLEKLSSQAVYLNGIIDHRNNYWLPTTGHFLNLSSDVGKRTAGDSSNTSISGKIIAEKYLPISRRINILLKVYGEGIFVNKGSVHDGELIRYGGANNIRGYLEDSFKSDWLVIPTFEINFSLGKNQRLSFFTDIAVQSDYNPLPYGMGIGFVQITKTSALKLFYGIGRGDRINDGKIHIQFLTRL
jgi:hypothetical protein